MSETFDTMMDPPVEDLLERCGSKFSLVALASQRAREINTYYGNLGGHLGTVVPPQITSHASKSLSIAFEEIEADKIVPVERASLVEVVELVEVEASGDDEASSSLHPMLEGRRIVLGVTGGIAAYKVVEVCRRLVDAGAHVSPIMTAGAQRFLGETTLSALASEKVQTSLWDEDSPIPHTIAGQNADLVLVAPATARLLGNYASGISSDLLTATLLATRAPVIVCPAMHTEMWEHPSVVENVETLRRRGVTVVDPEEGRLAGGDIGAGRLASADSIVQAAIAVLSEPDLLGQHVVVTAGGTREPIDPVRFIANRSSGKQGHALAEEAHSRGASVELITTTALRVPSGIERIPVDTADQMYDETIARAASADVVVMAAAVADFRPASPAEQKLKKSSGTPEVVLVPTLDILAALGEKKPEWQILVGFAAETDDVVANAEAKLASKRVDIIVANDVSAPATGFEHDTNEVTLVSSDRMPQHVPLASKREIAKAVWDSVAGRQTAGRQDAGNHKE